MIFFNAPSVEAATSTYGPFYTRPTTAGEYGGVFVDLNYGISEFSVSYDYWGIHQGEPAYISWYLYDMNGKLITTRNYGSGDASGWLGFYDLVPGGLYQLVWESHTNNDTAGGFSVHVDGRAYR